jgi:hypothetical protein
MESFEGFRKSGTFVVAPGTEVQGELILKGDRTTLDLYSKDFFTTHDLPDGCIAGTFHDRTKVSLIDCVTMMDYGDEFDQVIFFTEALEFIFAASDLIECGWNVEEWAKQSSTVSHPFDRFRLDYEPRLKDLKRALAEAKADPVPAGSPTA